MEIKLPVSELKSVLPALAKVLIRHSSLPVLQQIRIDRSTEGVVQLQVTDLDAFASCRLTAMQPGKPVAVLIPFERLSKTVKGCSPTDILTLLGDEQNLTLRYTLAGRPVDQTLTPIMDVSDPDAHYVMGTDGRHLFSANSFRLGLPATVMIPHHRFLEWNGFRQDGPWQLNVPPEDDTPTSEWLQLKSNRWSFLIRLARHEVPKWRLVLPRNKSTTVTFGPKAVEFLLEALPQLPGKDEAHQPVAFQVFGNRLSISGYDPRADHRTTFPVDDVVVEGREILFSVNREFALKALRWGLNQLVFDDALSPMIFSNAGRRLVAMPVRTEGPAVAPAQDEAAPTRPTPSTASTEPDAGTEPEPQPEPDPMTKNRIPPTTEITEAEPPDPTTMPVSRVPAIHAIEPPAAKPSIRAVLDQIDVLRDSLRSTVRQFGDVVEALRQIDKERRTSDREVEVIREKLRALQGVRF